MPDYRYTGVDDNGQKVSGAMNVMSEAALESRLKDMGIWLLESRRARRTQVAGYVTHGHRYRAGRRDLVAFFIQLSLLLNAGIPLVQALERLEDDFATPGLGSVIIGLKEQISNGIPLHEALGAFPRVFPPQMVSLIKAGEASGTLPDVLNSLRRYLEWLDNLQGDIRQAVTYPIVVILAVIGLVLVLLVYVVPQFEELFRSMRLEVPALTRAVMSTSRFVSSTWYVWLGLLVGLPLAWRYAQKAGPLATTLDRLKLRLPYFGELVQMFALSRFAHNLAMMHKAGIPLARALEICRHLVGNRAIAEALGRVLRGVIEGSPMTRTMAQEPVFSRVLVTMLSAGEASGKLDVALDCVAEYYDTVIPRQIKAFFSLFEPAIMLALVGVVGVVALALILPMLQLWEAAGR